MHTLVLQEGENETLRRLILWFKKNYAYAYASIIFTNETLRHWDTKTPLFLDQKFVYKHMLVVKEWNNKTLRRLISWFKWNYAYTYTSYIQMRHWDTETPLFLDKKCVYAYACFQRMRQWDIETPHFMVQIKLCLRIH